MGIAADETKRLERLQGTNKVSLLKRYGYTEQMAYDLCKEYGLLSPIYNFSKRGGCWFCPSATIKEYAHIKSEYPELWEELRNLSFSENLVSQNFKYGKTFAEVDKEVDIYLNNMEFEKLQKIIAEVLNVEEDEITMDTTFVDDLGADSLDVFQIIMGIEEEFDIEIPNEEAEKIVSVGDAVEQIKNALN